MICARLIAALLAFIFIFPEESFAVGRRGGGGRSGGGGMRMGGGGGARPSMSAPRPASRPNVSRPSTSQRNFNRPSPSPAYNRQTGNRQTAGLRPSTRPSSAPGGNHLPSNYGSRPSARPSLPPPPSGRSPSNSRPSQRPSTSLPSNPSRPATSRPAMRNPSNLGTRPGGNRPPIASRPNNARPVRPSGQRPTPGNVGDFLGLDKPLRPATAERPATLPGRDRPGDRPNRPVTFPGTVRPGDRPKPGERPNLANRPGLRPESPSGRPGIGNRPEQGNRPDFGNRWGDNNVINRQPSWANINSSTNLNIHNRWDTALTRPARPGWKTPPSNRRGYWRGWGDGVRHGWGHYHHHGGWFNNNWWNRHPHRLCGWHYHYWNHNRGWYYWWRAPTWGSFSNWFAWQTPATVWSEPVYYDYGSDGNVVYQDNSVSIGGTQVATAEEFAQSAMDLATVEPPESSEQAEQAEWMPLGTFAVSTDERDTDPDFTVQLAVNREGIVAGTLYNIQTDEAQSLQGAVDRETQRVALRFGENETLVAETGLYNLTQDEVPLLMHFGTEKTENYLLVRLDEPEQEETPSSSTSPRETR